MRVVCCSAACWFCFVFFFQAEDGIRDLYVTGVQTCALPICAARVVAAITGGSMLDGVVEASGRPQQLELIAIAGDGPLHARSEERRVGKECRSRWSADH